MEPYLFRQRPPSGTSGLGRGLLIASFMIDQRGGHIWLDENDPGEGACFAILLPLVQTCAIPETAATSAPSATEL